MNDYLGVHLLISGEVQGVGYRYFAIRIAQSLGITGYVCNLPNGKVEIEAEGTKESLLSFIEELKRGPRWSHVTKIDIEWLKYQAKYTHFSVRF